MRRPLLVALVAALLVTAAPSLADSPDQKAAAQVLFEKARDLVEQKNFAEACPKFAESLRLDPGLGTMLWLADCYENNGQTASAWAEFKEAASIAALKEDPREAVARRRIAAIEPKLTYLAIALPAGATVSGLEVRRDGLAVTSAEKVPVDPGIHALSATAPGRKPWNANVDVAQGRTDALVVNVPVLEAIEVVSAPAPPPATQLADTQSSAGNNYWSTMRVVGASVAAVGIIGLGIGTVLGIGAKSALNDSNRDGHCLPDNECDATGTQRRNDAKSQATGSTIAFVAGSAFLVGGALLFFAAPSEKKTGLVVVPSVSAREAGLVVFRRF
jgi:hypothetical protein